MTGQDVRVELDPKDEARLVREIKGFDRELSKALVHRIREVAQPLGRHIIEEIAPELPRRGGLAYRIAGVRGGTIRTRTSGNTAGVELGFRKPRVLRYIEQGKIPHPVFADVNQPRASWRWATQSIRSGLPNEAFKRNAPKAREAVRKAIEDAAKTISAGTVHR